MSGHNSFKLHYKFSFCGSHFNQFLVIYKNREQSFEQLAKLTKMMYFPPCTPSTRGAYEQLKTPNATCKRSKGKKKRTDSWGGLCVGVGVPVGGGEEMTRAKMQDEKLSTLYPLFSG